MGTKKGNFEIVEKTKRGDVLARIQNFQPDNI